MGIVGASWLTGCGHPETPEQVEKKQKECEHEWVQAASGEIRCKKCGMYKPK
jgi:hypothetical protein